MRSGRQGPHRALGGRGWYVRFGGAPFPHWHFASQSVQCMAVNELESHISSIQSSINYENRERRCLTNSIDVEGSFVHLLQPRTLQCENKNQLNPCLPLMSAARNGYSSSHVSPLHVSHVATLIVGPAFVRDGPVRPGAVMSQVPSSQPLPSPHVDVAERYLPTSYLWYAALTQTHTRWPSSSPHAPHVLDFSTEKPADTKPSSSGVPESSKPSVTVSDSCRPALQLSASAQSLVCCDPVD